MLNWTKHVCLLVRFCDNKLPHFHIELWKLTFLVSITWKANINCVSAELDWSLLDHSLGVFIADGKNAGPQAIFHSDISNLLDEILIKSCPLTFLWPKLIMWLSSKSVKLVLYSYSRPGDITMSGNLWPYYRKKEWPARNINSMYHNYFSPTLSQNCTSYWSYFGPWYVKVNPSEILFIFHQTKFIDHWEFHEALFSSVHYDFSIWLLAPNFSHHILYHLSNLHHFFSKLTNLRCSLNLFFFLLNKILISKYVLWDIIPQLSIIFSGSYDLVEKVFKPEHKDLLEKAMAPHFSTLAWKIPWTEEPGALQSMGSLRVGHDWVTSLSLFTFMHWRRKWQPSPVFLPGESQVRGNLVGCHLRGHTELDTTEVT